jgi:hypothetical protein
VRGVGTEELAELVWVGGVEVELGFEVASEMEDGVGG